MNNHDLIEINNQLTRKLVSFQANKNLPFYRWTKYKEGFSAELIDYLFNHFLKDHHKNFLDPFAGSGTSLFKAAEYNLNSTGIELLPIGYQNILYKLHILKNKVDINTLINKVENIKDTKKLHLNELRITKNAYPKENFEFINSCLEGIKNLYFDNNESMYINYSIMISLEDASFTRKDGQFLRWDKRSLKNLNNTFDKGIIFDLKNLVIKNLNMLSADLLIFNNVEKYNNLNIVNNTVFNALPMLMDKTIDVIITSPPYCNRYDYTRTYALELAFLGVSEEQLKALRQSLLYCTTENKPKELLKNQYKNYDNICENILNIPELKDSLFKLDVLKNEKKLNNPNIIKMIQNYFIETAFWVYECARVLSEDSFFVIINDNVQFSGVEIEVDIITSQIGNYFGLQTKKIWVLPKGKGNSSQQMAKFGRNELRKSVIVFTK